MQIQSYAVFSAGQELNPYVYEAGEPGPHEVEIAITHCGICHSDIHLIDNDWKSSIYPLVPGHEIIGVVSAMGPLVRGLAIGQRVGAGWQASACLECDMCMRGYENMCRENKATCVGHHGGFARAVRVDSRFAFPIPDDLDSENAAPLLCAGVTVYSPMWTNGVRPGMRVGIIGVGGLGHLAVQFARAFGCEVTAFSTSPDKEDEARALGSSRFVDSRDMDQMAKAEGSLDFILNTVFVQQDWMQYMKALRPFGRLCFVGDGGMLNIPAGALMSGQKSVTGSIIGGRVMIREMLDFAARNQIRAMTEVLPLERVNDAITRVRRNEARYRMVLKV
jgi:uncharacterized zinc-type alcohol dehydrogenase-like protein